jgi:DNA-binding NtrC family response regulator
METDGSGLEDVLIGRSAAMQELRQRIVQVARFTRPVLINGPTGTGKELVARALHQLSEQRQDKSFMAVNCGGLSQTLYMSELCGHERGSFTGAEKLRKGMFELAHDGTLFLDEIGKLKPDAQAALMRVLETQSFTRVGGSESVQVNVRIVTAANEDLEQMVIDGHFTEDLLYRIRRCVIRVPTLEEHLEDIPLLLDHYMKSEEVQRDLKVAFGNRDIRISDSAIELMQEFKWPGNVRQLFAIFDDALTQLKRGEDEITEKHLPLRRMESEANNSNGEVGTAVSADKIVNLQADGELRSAAARGEREQIILALNENEWNRAKTALSLSVNRTTLWKKMTKYGIVKPAN